MAKNKHRAMMGRVVRQTLWLSLMIMGILASSAWARPLERVWLPEVVEGFSVSALRAGPLAGESVILVHGTPGSAEDWEAFLEAPGDRFRWTAIDRPGFGRSLPQKAEVRLSVQAEILSPLFEEAPAILVGHSLGAAVVIETALHFPERVRGVVLVSGALDPELESVWWVQRWGASFWLRWLLPRSWRNANDEIIAYKKQLEGLQKRFSKLRVPIVVLHGTEDDLVPYENVAFMKRELAPHVPAFEVIPLEGADHYLPWKQSEAIRQAVRRASALGAAGR